MNRRTQHGFTLVEVMVVVAIIAVLSVLATVAMRPRSTAVDASHRFRALVDQASRDAVRGGALRPDVATALGTRARTQIIAADDGRAFYVQKLVEDASPATTASWQTVESIALPTWVTATAYSSQLGGYTSITTMTNWTSFSIACFPDGTCERKTVFFQSSTGATSSRQSRVAVLPVASAQVIARWN
jgi:prepilin-type N-terminal cleavage/methylation domain-containing protein